MNQKSGISRRISIDLHEGGHEIRISSGINWLTNDKIVKRCESMIKHFKKDQLIVKVYENKNYMGKAAAKEVAEKLKELIYKKTEVTMAFAAAPSQNEFLDELTKIEEIDWTKVVAFHLDEYIGLEENAPQKFVRYLKDHFFDKVKCRQVYFIDQVAENMEKKLKRYSELLHQYPLDIACIGIGENGHIAFNDPHVADFADPEDIKKVDLDEKCRMQQVNDGCFTTIDEVPTSAITLTIPTIMSADYIYCMVPTKNKSQAVYNCLKGTIQPRYPASILRSHQRATLYLDNEAISLL